MNDSEELRFGMQLGASVFRGSQDLAAACKTPQRHGLLLSAFENAFNHFWNAHAFDTYVFCTSEHEKNDNDGRLSMWRGYGGNGTGSAIVLDTAKLNVYNESPLILDRVTYAARDERSAWVQSWAAPLAELLQKFQPPDDQLHIPAIAFLERLKRFLPVHKGPWLPRGKRVASRLRAGAGHAEAARRDVWICNRPQRRAPPT